MAKLIIGIHGLANKPDKQTLESWWKKAIAEGLEKNRGVMSEFNFRMVYWRDFLHRHPLHLEDDYKFDSLYNEEPYTPANPGALKEHADSWRDDIIASMRGVGGSSVDFLKKNFDMEKFADWVVGRLAKDLAFYYDESRMITNRQKTKEPASKVLRDELKNALVEEKGNELMLIAHSMGSIIAYDALRDLGMPGVDSDVSVKTLVTIGAPLGLPHVKHKIKKERSYDDRVRTPSIVTGNWVNLADRKDPISADFHLHDDYGANDAGIRVTDDVVENDYHRPGAPDKRNHHKSYGYLRTPELSELINQFLS